MPNHDIRIEEAEVWDILDWEIVADLSLLAPSSRRDLRHDNVLAWYAKELIEAASRPVGRDDEQVLHRIASRWIPLKWSEKDSIRRQAAGVLADKFGARADRFIEYLAYKWGLFNRR